ncbi:MAG: hypothetical protein AAGF92_10700 [Myxococcota bacterium]
MRRALRTATWFTLAALLVAGCGDSEADTGGAGSGGDPSGTGGAGGVDVVPSPLYAVCGALFTPDGTSGYVALVPDLEPTTTFELSDTLEVPGGTLCAATGDSDALFLGVGERSVIQRFRIEDDQLVFDDEFGLAGLGITSPTGRNPIHFLSQTRAYFIDGSTLQVVVWNPEEMIIEDSFSIEGLQQDDYSIGVNFVDRVGDRFVMSARYFRPDESAELLATAVIIDSTDDSVRYAEDARCGNLAWSTVAGNGDVYFASHPSQAARVRAGQAGDPVSAPCLLRIRNGENEFDPTFYVELNDLTGGRPTGALLRGSGNSAYVLAYDETVVAITPQNESIMTILPAWRYWALDFDGSFESADEVTAIPHGAGYGIGFVVDRTDGPAPYIVSIAGDLSSGTLFDIGDPDGFVEGLTAPGFLNQAIRVR